MTSLHFAASYSGEVAYIDVSGNAPACLFPALCVRLWCGEREIDRGRSIYTAEIGRHREAGLVHPLEPAVLCPPAQPDRSLLLPSDLLPALLSL